MYDILFVGPADSKWSKFKARFPLSKRIDTAQDIQAAAAKCFTSMVWIAWGELDLAEDFNFDYQAPDWDQKYIHTFRNGKFYDGVSLFPRRVKVTARELDYRFFFNKKEIDIQTTEFRPYDMYRINTYEEYLEAQQKSLSPMFWVIWNNVIEDPNFQYDYQVPKHNHHIPHIFKNGQYYDGICLFSKTKTVSRREFEYRFFTTKKEIDIKASDPTPFDIVFISYNESTAAANFRKLLDHCPGRTIYRVNGIKGIHNAHICAAELVNTDMFWVVDADAEIVDRFDFDYQIATYDTYSKNTVHVWSSQNPVNDLVYGYGGVKLLPRRLTLDMKLDKPDMSTSISTAFKAMDSVSNITAFNTDPFTTWRSAFRECAKLASKTIQGQIDAETDERLAVWKTFGSDQPYGKYAIAGAHAGEEYGRSGKNIMKINDYDWLREQYDKTTILQTQDMDHVQASASSA